MIVTLMLTVQTHLELFRKVNKFFNSENDTKIIRPQAKKPNPNTL